MWVLGDSLPGAGVTKPIMDEVFWDCATSLLCTSDSITVACRVITGKMMRALHVVSSQRE